MASPRKFYNNPFTICIEGNIGSGKTTFLNHFQNFNNATILQEPVDLWRNVAGVNLLVSFSVPANIFRIYLRLKHHKYIWQNRIILKNPIFNNNYLNIFTYTSV